MGMEKIPSSIEHKQEVGMTNATERLIAGSRTFKELYENLESIGSLTTKSGQTFDSKYWIAQVEKAKNTGNTSFVTSTAGLRDTVKSLLSGKKEEIKYSSIATPKLELAGKQSTKEDVIEAIKNSVNLSIAHSESFKELYRVLDEYDGTLKYGYETLHDRIEATRKEPSLIKIITRDGNLREKVLELLSKEQRKG